MIARRTESILLRRMLRRAQAELRASELRYRTVTRATNEAVYDWDIRTSALVWNEGVRTLFGYAHEDVGPTIAWWESRLHPDDRARVMAGLAGLVESGKELWFDEYRYQRADGSYALVFDRGIVLRDEQGKARRMIGAMMDTTELRQTQARLALAARMASVGTLAAGVAHEINNPLAFVIANLDASIRRLGRAGAQGRAGLGLDDVSALLDLLEDAREGAERVRLIVRDLNTFARADDERRGPVDVARVLDSCVQMAMNQIRHRARVTRAFVDVPPVEANESRLAQVFLNLIVNAAQAIAEGAADRNEIALSTGLDALGRVVVEVRDTGTGIAPEVIGRVFDPFFTSKSVGEGLGLGLAICHGIITGLGGEIAVESELGEGSTFRVTLPVYRGAPAPADAAAQPAAIPAGAAPLDAPPARPRRGRVLIVDDEPLLTRAIAGTLEPEHDAVEAPSARDALARIRAGERYDVILCDLMMPEVTGMDFYEALGELAPELRPQIVFLTGGAFTERARSFLGSVENRLLVKPFDASTLLALIREMLGAA
ncbi:MAG: PAS domain-containing protein [Polyangiaceae bacterium]|nr:PAS domain-containing protein [Polyangiaceae bacterium]